MIFGSLKPIVHNCILVDDRLHDIRSSQFPIANFQQIKWGSTLAPIQDFIWCTLDASVTPIILRKLN